MGQAAKALSCWIAVVVLSELQGCEAHRFDLGFEHSRIASAVSRRADLGVTPRLSSKGQVCFQGNSGANPSTSGRRFQGAVAGLILTV